MTIAATFLRYVLYVVDSRMDGAWTNKFTYLFYVELVSEVTKLVVYLVRPLVLRLSNVYCHLWRIAHCGYACVLLLSTYVDFLHAYFHVLRHAATHCA